MNRAYLYPRFGRGCFVVTSVFDSLFNNTVYSIIILYLIIQSSLSGVLKRSATSGKPDSSV